MGFKCSVSMAMVSKFKILLFGSGDFEHCHPTAPWYHYKHKNAELG
jgi:hypothetical protein